MLHLEPQAAPEFAFNVPVDRQQLGGGTPGGKCAGSGADSQEDVQGPAEKDTQGPSH